MSSAAFSRRYVMLSPVCPGASGHARLECQKNRCAVTVHAALADPAPRVLLLAGDASTGAVMDLGLMHACGLGHAALCRADLAWHSGWHTLAIASDWPDGRLLLWGQVKHGGLQLHQVQEAVARYLALPAPDALPTPTPSSVLQLRKRLSP